MPAFRLRVFALLLSVALLGACSPYQKLLKSTNVNEKYEAAVKYYEKGDYFKAAGLLEPLIPLLKGRPESEKAEFYFAQSNFHEGNYTLSAYYFQTFAETYPSSPYAEEALFMHAKSLFRDSPEYELDQTNTVTAIESIQQFLNRFPESKFRPETENMSNELQKKLERKAFESARLYYLVRYNQSAVVAFNTFQQQYPASLYGEQAAFLKLESQRNLAAESVEEKQRERYLETIAFYQNFVDTYPQSKNLKTAEKYYDEARQFLKDHPDEVAKNPQAQNN
ncbi:outer membrane protein assembly factor BamD [Hymenobacter busanensis]|uniref:Outer membrane protein assembly factor BamD n=1 Tax=Hymenobacter busanensis TaxID=2607656 RepID=A0A7L4ZWH4_9BACT|nr:outer membrane protein assembly factor BamD [Hymenobacter busanensis]KAA9332310.1 outer membrane protein assembly factor BamD [Hymenobacter busanensis]QHJ07353.1 outer membrane protein assembly factor BamD [Hymenobacter busanensis]